ncbi:sulfotransferase family protein [Jannaschia pohangensis]|uniref:Sulfotransferase family protein n=1 Tax=Jannaschia pohangensis TaxID=390807 RepID=A0A1I3QUZ8_9RHOB|nr:sulfotransferase [Jannaschia pohangensis]SFJ37081.1 Sulfotransferase family protein [Jannaschia pohangensis]
MTNDSPAVSRPELMPNLFVIGASKSGSSALHAYLRLHPEIRMSDEKEPCFFVDQGDLEAAWPVMAHRPCSHDWEAYLDLWAGGEGARYRGEGSVYYSQAPHRSGVAGRIAAACPDARIIYIVREPVERAIGHYWQRAKEFQEPLPLDEAIRDNPIYRDTSNYALQLDEYLSHFPAAQIKVVVAERLRARRRETLDDLVDWLGLTPFSPGEEDLRARHQSPPTSRRARLPGVKMIRDSKAWQAARGFLPKAAVDSLRALGSQSFRKDEVDDTAARAALAASLSAETHRFLAMTNESIPEWEK